MDYPESRDARPGEVEMVLSLSDLKYKHISGNLRLAISPCCGHEKRTNQSFSINPDNGLWRCFHCDKAGNWVTFADLVKYTLQGDRYVDREPVLDFHDTWEQHFQTTKRCAVSSGKYPELKKFCNKRGISDDTLDAFRVSSKGEFAIQIPIFSWHEDNWRRVNARNVRVREKENAECKNWFEVTGGPTHLLMGNNKFRADNPDKRVFIFEGQWDMFSAYEIGLRNVFSLPNGASIAKCGRVGDFMQYIPHDWKVYVCTDMDAAGNKCAEAFFRAIGPDNFARLFLPTKDLNDWLQEKPDLTPDDVLATAKGFKPEMEVTTIKYDDFLADDGEEDELITETPFPLLNDYLQGGLYEGQTTGILAGSGAGKTTLVNQMAMFSASQGVRVGLISLEDTQKELRRKLKMVALGTPGGIETGHKHLNYTRLNGKATKHSEVVEQIQTFVNEDSRVIIVDNLDFISSSRGTEKLATFETILSIVDSNPHIHVIFIWQPNKVDPTKLVNSFNQKGESKTLQDASNYMNLNRYESGNLRILQVEKCRRKDPGSKANIHLAYRDEFNMYGQTDDLTGDNVAEPVSNLRILRKNR